MSRTDALPEQDATLVEPFTRADVLARTIPWRNYADAKLITAKELELVQAFDKQLTDKQLDMISDVCLHILHTASLSLSLTPFVLYAWHMHRDTRVKSTSRCCSRCCTKSTRSRRCSTSWRCSTTLWTTRMTARSHSLSRSARATTSMPHCSRLLHHHHHHPTPQRNSSR